MPFYTPKTKKQIQKAAEAHADTISYKSDKVIIDTTPWSQWNRAEQSFIAGATHYADKVEELEKELEKAKSENSRISRLIEKAYDYALHNKFTRHPDKKWQQFKTDNNL